jgi:hypothetical protein
MNNLRLFTFCLVLAAFMAVPSIGEQKKGDACDSVYLNDGRIITGIILEDIIGSPDYYQNAYLKIQSGPNQIRVIYYTTIKTVKHGAKTGGVIPSTGAINIGR